MSAPGPAPRGREAAPMFSTSRAARPKVGGGRARSGPAPRIDVGKQNMEGRMKEAKVCRCPLCDTPMLGVGTLTPGDCPVCRGDRGLADDVTTYFAHADRRARKAEFRDRRRARAERSGEVAR